MFFNKSKLGLQCPEPLVSNHKAHYRKPCFPSKYLSYEDFKLSFDTSGLSRKEETIIHRLRIGHTRLTHRYLMEQTGPFKTPELCQFCMNGVDFLSVRHILINCTGIHYTRRDFFITNSMQHLFENIPLSRILDFLKYIEIYKHI